MKYIDSEKLIAEIHRLHDAHSGKYGCDEVGLNLEYLEDYITSLQQEQREVDLEKLGEIARHLIAVKDHEEDMRLDEGEWLLLEKIGYPERFNARKDE